MYVTVFLLLRNIWCKYSVSLFAKQIAIGLPSGIDCVRSTACTEFENVERILLSVPVCKYVSYCFLVSQE